MNAEQSQFMITHVIDISNNIKVITNAIKIVSQEIGIN